MQARFGADRDIIGRRIDLSTGGALGGALSHATRQVIGVMPEGFVAPMAGPGTDVAAWIPLSLAQDRTVTTDSTWFVNYVIGRLAPGATVEQLAEQVHLITTSLQREFPNLISESRIQTAGAIGLRDSLVGDVRTPLLALLGAVSRHRDPADGTGPEGRGLWPRGPKPASARVTFPGGVRIMLRSVRRKINNLGWHRTCLIPWHSQSCSSPSHSPGGSHA